MPNPPTLPPGPDLRDPAAVAETFAQATQANLQSPHRHGSTIHIPAATKLLMTGDLHDHGRNLQRILQLADLDANPDQHLILHEIIHGPNLVNGRDLSIRTLARVASLKLAYPDRVHILLANHELAQLLCIALLKNGVDAIDAFDQSIELQFHTHADTVRTAMNRFIRSMPLAVRCPNGLFCCHSVPSPHQIDAFDTTVIDRHLTDADLARNGHAYQMVWGRRQTPDTADRLADAWQTNLFVMGHQPVDMGYDPINPRMLILASNHDHGVALPINLANTYTMDDLINAIIPLNSVV